VIFVTVGNATQRFSRLLTAVDRLAAEGFLGSDRIFVQSGNNPDFHPRYCEARSFLPRGEFDCFMEEAELIICHGGCTQLQAVRLGKMPVVMPRRKKYGEHINDHQVQLVEALASEGWIIPAYEAQDLCDAIAEARRRASQASQMSTASSRMLYLVSQAIEELIGKP